MIVVDTISQGLALVASGKHDAVLFSKLIGVMAIKEDGVQGLHAGPTIPDYKRTFAFAVKKGDADLLEKLNQGLLIIKTNGVYEKIYDKWLTADDPWRKWRKIYLPLAAVSMGLTSVAGVWLVMLSRQITKRKKAEEESRQHNTVLKGINRVLGIGLGDKTVDEMCEECLTVAEELTASTISFIGEIGPDGSLHDLAISNPGWEACAMYDRAGHRKPPGSFAVHGIYGRVLITGERLEVHSKDQRRAHRIRHHHGKRHVSLLPAGQWRRVQSGIRP